MEDRCIQLTTKMANNVITDGSGDDISLSHKQWAQAKVKRISNSSTFCTRAHLNSEFPNCDDDMVKPQGDFLRKELFGARGKKLNG